MAPSTKKKRVSKKNRASWRKHIDIKDVEDFLEDQRQEERIGKFSEKPDEELFVIDNKSNKKLLVSAKERRKAKARRPAKCFQILENTSKVEDPIAKRNHVKQKRNGRNLLEEFLNPKKSQRVIRSLEDRKKYYTELENLQNRDKSRKVIAKDIWEEEDAITKENLNQEYISKHLALHQLQGLGKPLVRVHDNIRHKNTKLKALELPHPGTSYNPSFKSHQDLMKKVIERESEVIKTEKHLKRVTTAMFSKLTEEQRDLNHLTELASGLPVETDSHVKGNKKKNPVTEQKTQISNDSDDDDVYNAVNPPVQNKKKDKKAKRKKKEQKELERKQQKKLEDKKQKVDLNRLKTLSKEADTKVKELLEIRKRRKKLAEKKKYEPRRLSKLKFEEPDIDAAMIDEISGNLRNVEGDTSLLVDRFKNFQKRSILPTSVDLGTRKRRKIKRFVRNTHKEPPEHPLKKKKATA